jgi:hypothetical protein
VNARDVEIELPHEPAHRRAQRVVRMGSRRAVGRRREGLRRCRVYGRSHVGLGGGGIRRRTARRSFFVRGHAARIARPPPDFNLCMMCGAVVRALYQ